MEENTKTDEGSAEKFFKEFGKKMDQFAGELKEAGSRAEVDLQKKFEELKEAAQKIKTEAQKKERWQEVEASLKKAGEELENAFKAAFKKKE
jgi:phosphoglycerate-specific signal transduction histidine kinase